MENTLKSIGAMIAATLISCGNPLDKTYEPLTYRTDYREIYNKDTLTAFKIKHVVDFAQPELGETYKDILDKYPEVVEIQRIKDSLDLAITQQRQKELDDALNELKIEQAKAEQRRLEKKRIREAKIAENKRRELEKQKEHMKEQHALLDVVLNNWGVKEVYRKAAHTDLDSYSKRHWIDVSVSTAYVSGGKLRIDIGALFLEVYIK